MQRRAEAAAGDLRQHVADIDHEGVGARRHRHQLVVRRAHFEAAVGVLRQDGEKAVVLVLGGAELLFIDIAVGRIVEQAHEGDRLAVARAQRRGRHVEADRQRPEQPVAQRGHRVEIGLDRLAKAVERRPAIDAMQRLAGLHVGIVGGQRQAADVEALFQVGLVARIMGLVHRHIAAIVACRPEWSCAPRPAVGRSARPRANAAAITGLRHAVIDELESAPALQDRQTARARPPGRRSARHRRWA